MNDHLLLALREIVSFAAASISPPPASVATTAQESLESESDYGVNEHYLLALWEFVTSAATSISPRPPLSVAAAATTRGNSEVVSTHYGL